MTEQNLLRLKQAYKDLIKQTPEYKDLLWDFCSSANLPMVAETLLTVSYIVGIDEMEVQRSPTQAALIDLIKSRVVVGLRHIQDLVEKQIRELEKVK